MSTSFEHDEHYDSTSELTLEVIKQRAAKGIVSLTGRTFLLQVISLGATILLTLFLEPAQYGVFFLVSAVINFFAYFSDVGFAAALIQKKDKLTNEDLYTAFSVQQLLVFTLVILIFLLTPAISNWYKMNPSAVYLLWALAFSLILSSLKTIPSVLLERKLDFNGLIVPQIFETLAFNVVVVYLAWKGFGVTSFTVAVLVRGLVGLILMYIIQPWRPAFLISRSAIRSLFSFGVPYQLNTFLALLKDDGMTTILGGILGASGMGLLGWAQKWAAAPLRFFMDQVIRVTFPAYSRLQDDKKTLSAAVTKSIFFICLIVFPCLVLLVLLAPLLTTIIPKYNKWQPAIFALSILTINAAWAAVTTPITNLFNSVGKILVTFKLMIMWTVLTWVLIPFLALRYGVNGAAIGFALVGTSSIAALVISRKYVKIDFWFAVIKPLAAAILMGGLIFVLRALTPVHLASVIFLILSGFCTYAVLMYLLCGEVLIEDVNSVVGLVRRKHKA